MLDYVKEVVKTVQWSVRTFFSRKSPYFSTLSGAGFTKYANKIDRDVCGEIREKIDSCLNTDSSSNIWADEARSDHRIYGFENIFPEVKGLIGFQELKMIGENYLGCRLGASLILAARMNYKEENAGSGGGWHRDSPFTHQFKAIIYLSDVSTENGPFQYMPGSHKLHFKIKNRKKLKIGKYRFTGEDITNLPDTSELCLGSAGNILLADTKGIHRGKPIKVGERYALTLYFWEKEIPAHFSKLAQ